MWRLEWQPQGGATLEVAAPAARVWGGASSGSGNMVSSWRWWQGVLLLLLVWLHVWLVVPAEAVGSAQAAGGMAAAVAAAAAASATSTVLN